MIHPINIPEDLLASNPRRPQFFRPRPKLKINYGPDGRRLGSNGAALEPISPNTYWNDVFMRTFIRRMLPVGVPSADQAAPAHLDIVDLSPSPGSNDNEAPQFSSHKKEDETEGNGRKSSCVSTISTNSSVSIPDRPSPELGTTSSTDEEEAAAEGDALARMGTTVKMGQPALTQRVSRKAIRSILKGCCQRAKDDKMEEFARLDFSQMNLFGGEEAEELELMPEKRGCRVWTTRRRPQVRFEGEQQQQAPQIRFHIASVRIRPGKEATIQLEAHNAIPEALQFKVESHLHKVQDEQIGECLRIQSQVERLEAGKETPIHVKIALDGRVQRAVMVEARKGSEEERDENGRPQFLMAILHGRVVVDCGEEE